MRRALAVVAACLLAGPATAWERTLEWRFTGAEIVAFTVTQPDFDEDPTQVEILLADPMGGEGRIEFEDDGGFEDCADLLAFYKGDPTTTLVLTVNTNARTLNGSILVQCATR